MSASGRRPVYQVVDGLKYPPIFRPDLIRSGYKYTPKEGDVFVCTFPRNGTTWTQQIVNLILNRGVSTTTLMEFFKSSPLVEMVGAEGLEHVDVLGPIKSHFPFHRIPYSPLAKYIHVVRNPKDTVTAHYHLTASYYYKFEGGNFDDYFEIFINGENDYGDYFDHVLGWYEHRNDPNVLCIKYEELKRDTPNTVLKIAGFMGEKYLKMLQQEPDVFNDVLRCSSLEYMKFLNREAEDLTVVELSQSEMAELPEGLSYLLKYCEENRPSGEKPVQFVRKGIVGNWRDYLSEEQSSRLDKKIDDKLKGTELYEFWKSIGCI